MADDGVRTGGIIWTASVSHDGTLRLSTYREILEVALQDVTVESSLGSIGILNVPQCVLSSVPESQVVCLEQWRVEPQVHGIPMVFRAPAKV